jgi:hypothetical protein
VLKFFPGFPPPLSQHGSAAKSLSSFDELAKVRDCIERSNSADAGLGSLELQRACDQVIRIQIGASLNKRSDLPISHLV